MTRRARSSASSRARLPPRRLRGRRVRAAGRGVDGRQLEDAGSPPHGWASRFAGSRWACWRRWSPRGSTGPASSTRSEPRVRGWSGCCSCCSWPGWASPPRLIGGRFRFRWSWTDAAVVALIFLVGLERPARARSPAGDQPGLGVGGPGLRLHPGPEPAARPRRVDGPRGRAGGHGRGGLGLRAVPGARRDSPAPGALPREPGAGAPRGERPARSAADQGLHRPPARLERGVRHVRPGQLAGRLPGRPAGAGRGGRGPGPGRSTSRRPALGGRSAWPRSPCSAS